MPGTLYWRALEDGNKQKGNRITANKSHEDNVDFPEVIRCENAVIKGEDRYFDKEYPSFIRGLS